MRFLDFKGEIGVSGLIDIVLMSVLLYTAIVWFKKRRAVFVLTGILICGLVYIIARLFHLFLITSLLQAFSTVFLVALIIIFQEEIKYFFEQVAVWSLNRKFRKKEILPLPQKAGNVLVNIVSDLTRDKIGALVVIKGKDLIVRHLGGGVDLNGEISEPLLKSIFDPHSAGHDGAVVIEGDRVVQFGCRLPLSKDFKRLRSGGTRHAAALGLAEVSDALCLAVSEESGKISVARNGTMAEVKGPKELREVLEKFYEETALLPRRKSGKDFLTRNWREKLTALIMTLGLWFVLVYESRLIHKTFYLPVEYAEPSPDFYVEFVEPQEVEVTFSGPRRTFQFMNGHDIRLALPLFNYHEGVWQVPISEANLLYPRELRLEEMRPRTIKVEVEKK